jgi:uncharacterized membrane protein
MIITISSELLNPDSVEGLAILTRTASTPFHEVVKYLNMLTIVFIVIGFMFSVLWYKKEHFDIRYLLLSFGALSICICGLILPYFASSLNTSRLYQISLIFLAPFCVFGEIAIFRVITEIFKVPWANHGEKNSLQVLSVFFAIFLLFNSGWADEAAKDHPGAFLNNTIDYPKFNELEITGLKWLTEVKDDKLIYADDYRWLLLNRFYTQQKIRRLPMNSNEIKEQSYLYFGNFNIINKSVILQERDKTDLIKQINNFTGGRKIYDNSGAEIYYGL